MWKLGLCVLASAVLLVARAPELEAQAADGSQTCNHCVEYYDFGWYHYFDHEFPPLPNEFDGSHLNSQPGTCDQNHSSCEEAVARTLEELPTLLEDPSSLAKAVKNSERIVFDWAGASLAVLDCAGNTVQKRPLRFRQWVALLLPAD